MAGNSTADEGRREQPIAAHYATDDGEPTKSPFGDDDQIGMLNLITPASRKEILSRIDPSRVYDLSVEYFPGMPAYTSGGDISFQIWMAHTPHGRAVDEQNLGDATIPLHGRREHFDVARSSDVIALYTHCGTHIDSLNHFTIRGKIWNGFSEREYLGEKHWHVCGADKFPPIIARGILVDVAGLHGVDVLPESYGITESEIRKCLAMQGTSLKVGDVVLIRTGRMSVWPNSDAFYGGGKEPGLTRDGAEYLAKSGAILVGSDNVAVEQWPSADPDNWVPVHTYLLAQAGIPLMEILNLEEIASDQLYEFAIFVTTLKIRGATGSPVRPIVMPLETNQ